MQIHIFFIYYLCSAYILRINDINVDYRVTRVQKFNERFKAK